VLRMNKDGSIPGDNPTLNGVRSHVFTYGHRNPQGLAFAGEHLFSCEHGPSTDDEVNLLTSGGNYGWPHVAGFRDDQAYHFADWSKASKEAIAAYDPNNPDTFPAEGVVVQRETDWSADNFVEPVKTLHTVPNGYNFKDGRFSASVAYLNWPTVAPSSIHYYPKDGPIVSWRNSLILTTLKTGAVLRLKLNEDGKTVQGDIATYFHTPNRYRALCFSPDRGTVYMVTDSFGNVLDYDGKPIQKMQNPGAIIVLKYAPDKFDEAYK